MSASLPPLLARWVDGILGGALPEETEATCDRCAMRPPDDGRVEGAIYFGESKCCTYWPQLHSFLAGRILRDPSPELGPARAELERQVGTRLGVSPLGLAGPGWFWLLYDAVPDAFGRADRMRCPFFEAATGRCGVWRHRESTCATWFCKYRRGAVGLASWDALRRLLTHLERSLDLRCALALDLGADGLAAALAERARRSATAQDLGDGMDAAPYARLWGRWAGRELDYYRSAAELVEALSPAEVLATGGAEAAALLAVARARLEKARDQELPPGPLVPGHRERLPGSGSSARVIAYRSFDPLELPAALLGALDRFDGRPTEEVVREIRTRDGLELTPDLLRLLVDVEVLVPTGGRG